MFIRFYNYFFVCLGVTPLNKVKLHTNTVFHWDIEALADWAVHLAVDRGSCCFIFCVRAWQVQRGFTRHSTSVTEVRLQFAALLSWYEKHCVSLWFWVTFSLTMLSGKDFKSYGHLNKPQTDTSGEYSVSQSERQRDCFTSLPESQLQWVKVQLSVQLCWKKEEPLNPCVS